MKESYGEGVAPHTDPESCAADRKVGSEALTGARTGQPLSGEIIMSGTPTLLSEAEGNTGGGVMRKPLPGPAPSETLCTCGNISTGPVRSQGLLSLMVGDGRSGKAKSHTPDMHAPGKSDDCIVPAKPPNKGRDNLPAEAVEGRRSTKGNTVQTAAPRTQCRKGASNGLQRVREAERFYAKHPR